MQKATIEGKIANSLKDYDAQKDKFTRDPEFRKREMAVCVSFTVMKAYRTCKDFITMSSD